ncbi:MAG TPA: GNAT family N-acetyltransferase [Planctomycetota bacterium]|nr:GNAT family N-acetyltransferase [Planctomycetota bacterium]
MAPSERDEVEHQLEREIDDEDDASLRALLALCFSEGGAERGAIFLTRRRYFDIPSERFWIRASDGSISAHAALRLRPITIDGAKRASVGGVSEVCVHPDLRGRGLVAVILEEVHRRLRSLDIPWAILFGDPRIYARAGYRPATNELRFWDPLELAWRHERVPSLLVRPLADAAWPNGRIDLAGTLF